MLMHIVTYGEGGWNPDLPDENLIEERWSRCPTRRRPLRPTPPRWNARSRS